MRFPFRVSPGLSLTAIENWNQYFARPTDRDRRREEGIWRRTQLAANQQQSGWQNDADARRRVVHYVHDFRLGSDGSENFVELAHTYLYHSVSLPVEDADAHVRRITTSLDSVGFERNGDGFWRREDLCVRLTIYLKHPVDELQGRTAIQGYKSVDIVVHSDILPENVNVDLPWKVIEQGMRVPDVRGQPCLINNLEIMRNLTPFMCEVGCGLSIEAGVPALHNLHRIYEVTDPSDHRFLFCGSDCDLVGNIISNSPQKLSEFASLFVSALEAKPTGAHRALAALLDHGHLVGPVVTNNFDGLLIRASVPELFVRRYDEAIPAVRFDDAAKALLVIGSHADRRRVQRRARERGLIVVYLDPEGYACPTDGHFISYPLEGPQDQDFVCRMGATDGTRMLCDILGVVVD